MNIEEFEVAHPWMSRWLDCGGIILVGVTPDGVLTSDDTEQEIFDPPYTIDVKEFQVSEKYAITKKMKLLARGKDDDLRDKENRLDEAHFLREDGQEIGFYDAAGGFWGPWSYEQTDPKPGDEHFEDAIHWIVCKITKSAVEWMETYLIVYRIVR